MQRQADNITSNCRKDCLGNLDKEAKRTLTRNGYLIIAEVTRTLKKSDEDGEGEGRLYRLRDVLEEEGSSFITAFRIGIRILRECKADRTTAMAYWSSYFCFVTISKESERFSISLEFLT